MRMKISPTVCVVLLLLSDRAAANEPGKSEARAASPEGPAKTERAFPVMGAEELRRWIAANPNEGVDLSEWTSITPELAEVVRCCDEEVRPVRRTRKVRYTVRVPAEGDSAADRKEEPMEKRIEYVAEVPGRALRLNGLTSLARETAEKLSGHIGDLELNGLRELTEPLTRELLFHQGLLLLNGVETISSSCATDLSNHEGPVSLQGLKRVSAEAYCELARFAWLPPSVIIEHEAVPERFVRWSDLAVEDTVDNYVRHMAAQTDVGILVDTDALKRLNLSVNDKMSAPAGTIETSGQVGTGFITKGSARIVADVMGLEEAVVWIATEFNRRLKKDSNEIVVVLTNDESFLVTTGPKSDKQPWRPEWEEVDFPKGEKTLWYRCKGEPNFDDAHLNESGWQPPWNRRPGWGMGGGAF